MLDTDIEGTIGVADHEAEVVTPRPLDPHHLPRERLTAFPLEPEGGQVSNRLRDEVLVGQPGLQVQPNLESTMRENRTTREWKSPSALAARSLGDY